MTNDIILTLSTEDKYRNKQEHRPINTIECLEFNLKLKGDGYLVLPMIKLLANNNCDNTRQVAVYRGATLVFDKIPLKQWLKPKKEQPEQLKRKNWSKT